MPHSGIVVSKYPLPFRSTANLERKIALRPDLRYEHVSSIETKMENIQVRRRIRYWMQPAERWQLLWS
jgi:hypothetical protein